MQMSVASTLNYQCCAICSQLCLCYRANQRSVQCCCPYTFVCGKAADVCNYNFCSTSADWTGFKYMTLLSNNRADIGRPEQLFHGPHTIRLFIVCLRSFLAADLAAVNRSATPWVIVGMHRGMYADDPSQQAPDGAAHVAQQLRTQLEDLLVQHQVDLVLNGHGRVYHHSCPVMKGSCVGYGSDGAARGPVHVMLGNSGAAMPLLAWAAAPAWLAAESFEHGFAQLNVTQTSLQLQVRGETALHLSSSGTCSAGFGPCSLLWFVLYAGSIFV